MRLSFLARRLSWFRWPLTARILSINLLVLVIPLYGIVRADLYYNSLVAAELDSMLAEGQIVAKALGLPLKPSLPNFKISAVIIL